MNMDKNLKPKTYSKDKFDPLKSYIQSKIGGIFGYCLIKAEEQLSKELFGDEGSILFSVAATTASNIHMSAYKCQGFTAVAGEPSIVLRIIRYDDTGHGGTKIHLNNEYFALVPTSMGPVLRIPLVADNFNKHFVSVANNTNIDEIITSMLPPKKAGSIDEYYSNPKSPSVDIEPIKESD